jgi:(+)-trans-carveol dehydrogenase
MAVELRGLDGKVVLITGAGRGQGANHARGFAEAGCAVAVTDICEPIEGLYETASKEQLDLTVSQVKDRGARGLGIVADVRDEEQMKAAVDRVVETLGPIGIVVNNAGVSSSAMLHEMPMEMWDTVLDIDLKGQAVTCKVVIPQMISRREGKIINISSGVINSGMTMLSHYVSAKYGVVGLTKALATELAEFGINVNAIAPGTIRPTDEHGSGMVRAVAPAMGLDPGEIYETVCRQFNLPGEKWRVEMQDITDAVLFLASENARMITGAVLAVDGGQTTR